MAILYVWPLVVCTVLFSSEACEVTLYSLNSQLSRIKEPRTDSPWKRQILKARSVSYLFPILYTLIQLDNSKHRSRAISRLSEGRKIHVLSCNIDYRFPWVHVRVHHTTCSHRGSWAHVSLPRTKNYQKHFPQKHIEIWRGEAKRLALRIWRFHGESVRGSLMRERFVSWDCTEPLGMLRWKTTPYKQRAAQPYKMATNWAQVTQKKQQQTHVYVSTIYFYS